MSLYKDTNKDEQILQQITWAVLCLLVFAGLDSSGLRYSRHFLVSVPTLSKHRRPQGSVSCWDLGATAAVAYGSWPPPPRAQPMPRKRAEVLQARTGNTTAHCSEQSLYGGLGPPPGEGRRKSDCLMRAAVAVAVAERPAQRIW